MTRAVCIFSGGLDSACTAAYLKSNGKELSLLTFYYGQRSKTEIERAREIAKHLEPEEHRIVEMGFMKDLYSGSNVLTRDGAALPESFDYSIVVPVRNAIFVAVASAWAMSIDAEMVAYGAHRGDHNYPDCRPEFAKSLEEAINLAEIDGIRSGVRKRIAIWSPALEGIDKSGLLRMGYKLLGDLLFQTWSCYTDGRRIDGEYVHCGRCESCMNRKRAFREAGIEDRTRYAA